MRLIYARHPQHLEARFSLIVEQLRDLKRDGKNLAVTQIIRMSRDILENGEKSQYLKKLKGLPITELKTKTRGGVKGGARAYGFFALEGFVLVNCEAKAGNEPSEEKLIEVLEVLEAWLDGVGEGYL